MTTRGRVVQGMRILRPALVDDRLGLGHILLDALGQQQAAGVVLVLGIAVAGTAGEEDDLLLGVGLHGVVVLELLEAHVAELHLHRRAGVDLQGDDAVLAGHLVLVDQFAHQVAVDLLDDVVALGGDVVLVPVAVLDELGQFGRVGEAFDLALAVLADHHLLAAAGQAAAVVLAVASARVVVVGVHVGLIAADVPFLLGPSQLRIWMPELAKPGLGMRNSIFSWKSAGLPPRQMRNVL